MLILDEPTSGVDPVARDGFWRLLIRLSREKGVTIFLSTHFMNEAERCDRMSMMHRGRVLAQGPPAELVAERKAATLEEAFHRLSGGAPPPPTRPRHRCRPTSRPRPRTVAAQEPPKTHRDARPGRLNLSRVWAFARREASRIAARLRPPGLRGGQCRILLMIVFGFGISLDVDH